QPQFVPPEAIVLQEVDGVLYIRQPDGSFIDVALPGDPLYTFDDQGALFEADEGWLIPIRSRGDVSLVLAPYDGSSARSVLQLDPPIGSARDSGGYHLGDGFFAVHRSQQVEVYDLSLDLQHEVDLVGSFDGFAGDGQLILESLPDGVTIVRRTFGGQEVVRARLSSEVLFAGGSVAWVAQSDEGGDAARTLFHADAEGTVDEVMNLGAGDSASQHIVQLVGADSLLIASVNQIAVGVEQVQWWTPGGGLVALTDVGSILAAPTPDGMALVTFGDDELRLVELTSDGRRSAFTVEQSPIEPSLAQLVAFEGQTGLLMFLADELGRQELAYFTGFGEDERLIPLEGTPAWVFDTTIVVQEGRDELGPTAGVWPDLVAVDVETGERTTLVTDVSWQYVAAAGEGVYFRYGAESGLSGTWRVGLEGSQPIQVSDSGTPAWSNNFAGAVLPQVTFVG
ncbi:MAG: hypothetical protein KDB16_19155, partial [Acidimicrobiales bacterium]|nr:hypothetical protein [Acidimicrobiales bacterium]